MNYQDDVFGELDSDATVRLQKQNESYRTLHRKLYEMKEAHPFISSLEEEAGEIHLTRKEHKILRQYISMARELDTMERENLYLCGHADAIRYLGRIGVLEQAWNEDD